VIAEDECSRHSTKLLAVADALAQIKAAIQPLVATETVPLKQALGRVLATETRSTIALPFDTNAAMDGYAFASAEIVPQQPFCLKLIGTAWAGKPFTGSLKSGECIRIFTGAVVPDTADSVVMQEQVTVNGEWVSFPAECKVLQNVRQQGEDVKQGQVLLNAGKALTAADLGLLAGAGLANVAVKRKLRVGFFSTGDELVSLEETLNSGQIYDSNRYLLHGLLTHPCLEIQDLGVLADEPILLEARLQTAAATLDVLITTGGASVGAADYITQVLQRCGNIGFWKIAMKPGKPLLFGQIQQCVFFGLPGNPVAVMTTFDKLVKPALLQLCGYPAQKALQIQAVCGSYLKKSAGREEYQRGILQQAADGSFTVTTAGKQGSHILSSLSRANCYIVLERDCTDVAVGSVVTVEPFSHRL